MEDFRDILRGNRRIIGDSSYAKNYLYRNIENAINYVLLKSNENKCIICKDRFQSLQSYVLHLRFHKKHVVEFLYQMMLLPEGKGNKQ